MSKDNNIIHFIDNIKNLLYNIIMKKIENPIEELTSRIQKHIDNGGNIYMPRRQLPYYYYLCHVKTQFSKRDGVQYSNSDIYKMCGFDFDIEYANYLEIVADLNDLSDEHNYVDKNFNFKKTKPQTYGKLCTLAIKYNTCLYDFMVIVTGFRLKESNINIDYEKALVERLRKAYPNGNTTGFKRENSVLYEMVSHLRKYRYPTLSTSEVLEILGFNNDRNTTKSGTTIDENKLLKELEKRYPDKKINSSIAKSDIYYKLLKASINNKKGLITYLNDNGFTYIQGNLVERLALMKVEENARYNFLMNKKKEFYISHNAENLTDKERFHLNMQLISEIAKIDNVEEFIKKDNLSI